MVRKLIEQEQPDRVAVIFDAKGKNFRHEMYEEYKANRPPMPDDLQVQIEPLHQLINALGVPLKSVEGVEADDVIGTLAQAAVAKNHRVLISTGDKDMAQLVNEDVALVNTMNNMFTDVDGVLEKFGVMPKQIIDFLALTGDKADNIPGVPGVGPKTASKWLQQYENLPGVINNAHQIKGKVGEKLRAAVEQLPLSYELATIKCDVNLEFCLDDLQLAERDDETLKNLYSELDFTTWLNELGSNSIKPDDSSVSNNKSDQPDYQVILSKKELKVWGKKLKQAKLIAFDTETDSLDYMEANLVGMSFAVTAGEAAYLPIKHDYEGAPSQLTLAEILKELGDVLHDPDKAKVGHNLKYDQSVLARNGVAFAGIQHDTMLESYVMNSTASRHDLDTLCELYLNHKNIKFEEVAGKGAKQITFNQVPLDQAVDYAAEDADMSLQLHEHFWPRLSSKEQQLKLYRDIEIPMVSVLSTVERNGVLIDAKLLEKQGKELSRQIGQDRLCRNTQ